MKTFFSQLWNKIKKDQETQIGLITFLAVMIIACGPLFTKLCINGHDIEYHLLRIESLKEGILMGRPFLKINVLYFGGAGYASSLFYPDFLLYIPAVLRVLGVSINASYHIFIGICILLVYLSSFYCAKKMTGSVYAASMASALMVLSPYFLGDVFIRSAVGEYTAFIFLPFVIYGIYNVLYEQMDQPWILAVGFGGVLLNHTNTMVFCLIFGAAAFVIKWKVFRKDLKVLGKLVVTAVVTMAVTAPYWLSMLEMYVSTDLAVSDSWITLEQTALQFSGIFSQTFPSLGFLLVVLAIFRALVKKNEENKDLLSYADWLLLGGAFFAILTTDLIPWERLNGYLSFVQFPWRFFIMATALLAFADAIILYLFIKNSLESSLSGSLRISCVLLLVLVASMALNFISKAEITYYDYSDDYYTYKPYTGNVIGGEWLPKAVTNRDMLIIKSDSMVGNDGSEVAFSRVKNTIEADLPVAYEYVDVPFVYYKGYEATLSGESGAVKVPVEAGANGVCRVLLNGQTGHLRVYYGGTKVQLIANIICLLTVLGLVVFLVKGRKKKLLTLSVLLISLCGCGSEVVYNEPVSYTPLAELAGKGDASAVDEALPGEAGDSEEASGEVKDEDYRSRYEQALQKQLSDPLDLAGRIIALESELSKGSENENGDAQRKDGASQGTKGTSATSQEIYEKTKEQLTNILEKSYDSVSDPDEKFFASAWLYKLTGDTSYRKTAEEFLAESVENKICDPEENQFYFYGLVGYLTTKEKTDFELSGKAMNSLFSQAIILSKTDESEIESLREDENAYERAGRDAELLLLANSISMSVDYTRAAEKYLSLAGSEESELVLYFLKSLDPEMK